MIRPLVPLLLLSCVLSASALVRPGLHVSGAYGFTHYDPDDLNEINRVFEAVSRSVGFKGYTVEAFNGHAEKVFGLGLHWKRVWTTLEAEIWEEAFTQRNVPFSFNALIGNVDAEERYLFVPLCLMFKVPVSLGRWLFTPGYGPGLMLGNATVHIATRYTAGRADDDLTLDFTSGAALIHRFGLDALYRPRPWLGAGLSGGYRISTIPHLEVETSKGYSYIFNILFNGGADPGDRLHLGYETLSFIRESEKRPSHHQAEGDMTGWYLWLRFTFLIGGLS